MKPIHLFLALLMTMVWGLNFVFIQRGLTEVSPLFLACMRFFFTAFPCVFFFKRPQIPFHLLFGYGFVMFVMKFAFLFLAMKVGVSVGLCSILLQLQVFFALAFAILFLKEKLDRYKVIGAIMAFSGIGVVAANRGESLSVEGLLLIIASAASFGMANVICKKIGKVNAIALVVWGSFIAWPPLLVISYLVEGGDSIWNSLHAVTWKSITSLGYIIGVSTFFGFGLWGWLLQKYPLGTVAPFTLLVPVFGILSAVLILGEPLESWKIRAALLIISGLITHFLGAKKAATAR